ncbi:MAG: hypothetical protein ACC654_11340, partial [Acidimicrobiia bacterium]
RRSCKTDGSLLLRLWLPALTDQLLYGWHFALCLSLRRTSTRNSGIEVLDDRKSALPRFAQQDRSLG